MTATGLRVSVIIPTYNRAGYLAEALESVAAQEYPVAEVIVVDDGSTDDTERVVGACGLEVHFLRQEHRGVAAARNRGLQAATGDVIAWLDSDDLWEPRYLASVAPLLEADASLGGVYCGASFMDDQGRLSGRTTEGVVPETELYRALAGGFSIATSSAVLVRKECLDAVGPFDEHLRMCEDFDMWLRVAARHTIRGVPRPLIRYRVHSSNTVANTQVFVQSHLAVVRKHFGAPDPPVATWPEAKRRAYGCAYRTAALAHIQQGSVREAERHLTEAAHIWPPILTRLGTFYELACGDQPKVSRGNAALLDLQSSGARLISWVDTLYAERPPDLLPYRRAAYGNAHLALAMLHDQAGDWSAARQHLLRAAQAQPRLLAELGVVRRLMKLIAGQNATRTAKRLQRLASRPNADGPLGWSQ